jgi:hypothetical protein
MDERNLQAEEPRSRSLVDEICARACELCERGGKVVHLVRHVMHAGAALRQEATYGRVVTKRLEQLEAIVADTHRRRAHALVLDRRAVLDLRAEETLIRLESFVEIRHGHAEMVNAARVHARDAIQPAT